MSHLSSLLESLKDQPRLDLKEQFLGDDGAKILAQFLNKNKFVRAIDLSSNNIGPSGVQEIFNALASNEQIQSVSFEWNNIGASPQGLNALASFIQNNKSIKHISLANNKISYHDISSLVSAL